MIEPRLEPLTIQNKKSQECDKPGQNVASANVSSLPCMSSSRQSCSGVSGGLVPSARVARPTGLLRTSQPCVGWLCSVAETVESAWGEWSSAGLISWRRFRAQPTQTHGTAVESGNQQRQHSHSFRLMPFPLSLLVVLQFTVSLFLCPSSYT